MENTLNTSSSIRPMRLPMALLFFGIPVLLFAFVQCGAAPYLDSLGVLLLVNYFVILSPHILFFFGALIISHAFMNGINVIGLIVKILS